MVTRSCIFKKIKGIINIKTCASNCINGLDIFKSLKTLKRMVICLKK